MNNNLISVVLNYRCFH